MKQLGIALAIVLGVVSCSKIFGGGGQSACENIGKQCGADFTKDDIAECRSDLESAKKELGAKAVDKFVDCADDADSCAESMGCLAGLAVTGMDQLEKNFEKGFDKATR